MLKRLSPLHASATRRRPSTARLTKKSSRGFFAPGPWIGAGADEGRGQRAVEQRLLELGLLRRVRGVAGLRRPLGLEDRHGQLRRIAALPVERPALVVGVDRGGRDDDERADEALEAVELLAVLAIHRDGVEDDVRAGSERRPQLRVVRPVGHDRLDAELGEPFGQRAGARHGHDLPAVLRQRRAAARPIMPVPPISTARGTRRSTSSTWPNPMPRGEGRDDAGGEDDPGRDLEREVDAVPGGVLGGDEHLGDELLVPLHAGAVLGAGDVAAGRHELDHDLAVEERDVELDELLVEPARELGVDDRAEDRDAEDAAELAARVHGRGGHARLLRRDDREHGGGHRDERDPEAEPGDRERPGERRDARRRRELPVDEQEAEPGESAADHHRHLRPHARRPAAGERPGDDHRDRQRGKSSAIWLPEKFAISCR